MNKGKWARALALVLVFALAGCGAPRGEEAQGSIVSEKVNEAPAAVTVSQPPLSGKATDGSTGETQTEQAPNPVDRSAEEQADPKGGSASETNPVPEIPVNIDLDNQQRKSIAMLNYLAVLSQEINSSQNSRLFLEEAYAALINNTNPEGVNELTESHLASLMNIIEKYRMIAVKRDRLQYIYEQNKALALKESVPNPEGRLRAVNSLDFKRLAASVIYMAIDSYSSYKAYNTKLDLQYLSDGWALDDEEAKNIHESRKRLFSFMLDIVREEKLPGELALNERAVEEYVFWKNNENAHQKLQFFESQASTYGAFGDYWLTLASCYYDLEEYENCLKCFERYESLRTDIFRKDYSFAKALPRAIVAAKEVYSGEEYISAAERYLNILVENTENTEWSLRYYAAQIYLDLYKQTKETRYLDKAYTLVLNNVNNLVAKQKAMNAAYLSEVKEIPLPGDLNKDASKEEKASFKDQKKKIEEYNKALKEKRKVEFPPVYEPLVLNCELLFALAGERGVSSAERNRVEGILHTGSDKLFLCETLNHRYTFYPTELDAEAQFEKGKLTLPVICLSEASYVKVTVLTDGSASDYYDWQVEKVERKAEDITSFKAILTSKACVNQVWSKDATVKVEIFDEKDSSVSPFELHFKVSKYTNLPFLPDVVCFEQVK